MRRSIKIFGTVAVAALVLGAGSAQAQLVGTFNAVGGINLTRVGNTYTATPTSPLVTVPSLTGIFAPLPVFSIGAIAPTIVGSGPMSIPSYISVGAYTFSLSNIAVGSFTSAACTLPAAAGQNCTPTGSGMNLSNVSNGHGGLNSTASYSVSGQVKITGGNTYNYTGVWTSQIAGLSYQQLNTQAAAGGAPISYSLNIVATAVPEPASIALMGTGLLALAGIGYSRRRNVA